MPFGEKCTRRGKCCTAIPCGLGLALIGNYRPCVALECSKLGRYQCGLVLWPSKYIDLGDNHEWKDEFLGELFASMLGVGMGCCTSPGSNVLYSEIRRKYKLKVQPKTQEVYKWWEYVSPQKL